MLEENKFELPENPNMAPEKVDAPQVSATVLPEAAPTIKVAMPETPVVKPDADSTPKAPSFSLPKSSANSAPAVKFATSTSQIKPAYAQEASSSSSSVSIPMLIVDFLVAAVAVAFSVLTITQQ